MIENNVHTQLVGILTMEQSLEKSDTISRVGNRIWEAREAT